MMFVEEYVCCCVVGMDVSLLKLIMFVMLQEVLFVLWSFDGFVVVGMFLEDLFILLFDDLYVVFGMDLVVVGLVQVFLLLLVEDVQWFQLLLDVMDCFVLCQWAYCIGGVLVFLYSFDVDVVVEVFCYVVYDGSYDDIYVVGRCVLCLLMYINVLLNVFLLVLVDVVYCM